MRSKDALTAAKQQLAAISDAPDLDAQRILLHVLGQRETSWLFTHPEQELTPQQHDNIQELIRQRATAKPLAYILGVCEFYGREFIVTPDVLIPRPATEELVKQALAYINRPMVIADIGTGSGCIAITLALEFAPPYEGGIPTNAGGVVFIATDISPTALIIAQQNAARHGLADKIEFLQGNLLEPLAGKKIDLIVSNPPYIPTNQISESLKFEPRAALDGGSDGQDYINQIKASRIPAIVEVTGGQIKTFNLN